MKDYMYLVAEIKKGKLSPTSKSFANQFRGFITQYEGQKVRIYIEALDSEKSLPQLAKVHAMIREIAKETGHTSLEIKKIIKERAGFSPSPSDFEESMADMDVSELNQIIQAAYDLCDYLDLNLF